ncbi:RNA polymerase sigma-70 factor [Bacteroides sp. KFT8]|mgnify:CR=1 FL=1|jgi:RNA polymerase sigma-70 factor (family 1)|uniref:RNA polymerase sigma-70 factor n=1 Tax=Bacteroides sp. KFT8 TaxID=2025659 RepID=UPI000C03DDE0|nr:RNA polymerase sigma-70 factor [Bacteroides sp. KFT8]
MKSIDDDILLLKLIRNGDETAFKRIFYKYIDSIERFIMCYIHDREKAQELALDLFIYIWEKRETLQIQLTLKAYLFQSAKNKAYTFLHKNENLNYIDDLNLLDQSVEAYPFLEMEELSRLIEEAVSLLPEKCKKIFEKSRVDNLTNKEIAYSLDISEKTVENQITIALKKIKKHLGEAYSYLW